MIINSVGIVGGNGKFGTFLHQRIHAALPDMRIRTFDTGSDMVARKETLACDAVIFAVPPKEYEKALRTMVPLTRTDSLIVDVCTVKMHTVKILEEVAGCRHYIASHPMFGPQSYIDKGLSLKGLQIVICKHTFTPEDYIWLENRLVSLGLIVEQMTPEEHDKISAQEQLLSQRIGLNIRRAGFALNERNIHTTSAQHFYRAMQIVGDDEALFKEASALNPYWPRVWAQYQLADAQHTLDVLNETCK